MMVIFVSIGFVSCVKKPDEIQEDKPLTESQKFVGYWDGKDYDEKWVFYPDGRCCYIEVYGMGYDVKRTNGTWSYNETTKILSTTVQSYQFLMTSISDNAWTGVVIGSGSSISRTRDNVGYARELIIDKRWKGTNGSISVSASSQYSGSTYNGKTYNIVWRLDGWSNDKGFPEFKDPSVFYKDGEVYKSRTYYAVEVERCIKVRSASFESSSSMLLQASIDDDYFYRDGGYGYKSHLREETLFSGKILFEDIYSSNAKLTIDGTMNGSPFKREYSLN
jgi:hypothetical protein